jgi:hypothetical protein
VNEAGEGDRDEARARRLYVLALVWGGVTLALLWWFARHFRA